MSIAEYQEKIKIWDEETFGVKKDHSPTVAIRVLEEVIELCQCHDIDIETMLKVIDQVYSKPVGEISQEVAGILVSLLNYSNHAGVNAEESLLKELVRIEIDKELIREKNKLKISV